MISRRGLLAGSAALVAVPVLGVPEPPRVEVTIMIELHNNVEMVAAGLAQALRNLMLALDAWEEQR